MSNKKIISWTDIQEIAIFLSDNYPNIDPLTLRFTKLHELILAMPNFTGLPEQSNEKILEAVQMAWMDELA